MPENAVSPAIQQCGKRYMGLFRGTAEGSEVKVVQTHCKSWDCPKCARTKSRRVARAITELFSRQQCYMYTFTFFHSRPASEAWSDYNASWNRFATAVRKRFGEFSYVRILESQPKSHYPHLHVLSTLYIPEKWFGEESIRAGFGFQLKHQRIDSTGASNYVRKYLSKPWPDGEGRDYRKQYRCRVYTCSQGLLDSRPPRAGWYIISLRGSLTTIDAAAQCFIEWNLSMGKVTGTVDKLPMYKSYFVNAPPPLEQRAKDSGWVQLMEYQAVVAARPENAVQMDLSLFD